MTFFKQEILFLEKNRPQSQGQSSKLKDLKKKPKSPKLVRFFSGEGGGAQLNYLMNDPWLYRKGLPYNFFNLPGFSVKTVKTYLVLEVTYDNI
jgi:hypothetical protein